MRKHGGRLLLLSAVAVVVTAGLVGLVPARAADPVDITVTTTSQTIGGDGCSLAEAILAANHDASVVPDPIGNGATVDTGCSAGSGVDVIGLEAGATYPMDHVIDEDDNYTGPTGTPLVTSTIIIEGHGAVLAHTGALPLRAFAVGPAGHLDLREVHVRDFSAQGGHGRAGGGGGLGAGGAIYVHGGSLLVQWSTFESNGAAGGNGGDRSGGIGGIGGGGGGGLGGSGGQGGSGGAGGGGSRGSGAGSATFFGEGGGGGGTVSAGGGGDDAFFSSPGGYRCGGEGADEDELSSDDGSDGCAGGGGGGGADHTFTSGDGGDGGYGGGGGGGAVDDGDGGGGGFGGGGGAGPVDVIDGCGDCGGSGGNGGFGGGGGAGPGGFVFGEPGDGGTFAGNAGDRNGGGGAGLGGAIFGHSAAVTVRNSTFTRNYAVRGVAGGTGAQNGTDAGGAIFTVAGTLRVTNSTVAGNESTGAGAGIVVYKPTTGEATVLLLENTIVAGNTGVDECFLRGGVSASGTHNLVTPHAADTQTACPGITETTDPQLGALALNPPGRTPTMALAPTSPAVDAGDAAVAPLDDQRGVLRPQGAGVDIGAYEYSVDVTPPSASPTQSPPANGAGWNTTDVTVTWNWADDAGGWGLDPANCTTSSTSSGEGADLGLAATCSDLAGNTGSAAWTVDVDKTPPTVTCGPTPTFVIGSTPTSGVTATVTDALSGPVASPVNATVTASDVAEPGVGSKDLTGADVAGNETTVSCPYVVAYDFLGYLQPISRTSYKRGSTIPVRFRLGDASGAPISDAAATALLSPTCLVHVTLDGQVLGCVGYNPDSDTFQYDLKTTKALSAGEHTIAIRVTTASGDVLNTDSMTVLLR
jgi:hypothetical protein